ncbi:MAG: 4-hydroxythreonine-4-phosphate dehydrogenase PdxA [Pseudomonadota bacterium]
MTSPIVISCGEPAGIGPEIAVKAHQAIGAEIPLLWLGDPRHLPAGTPHALVKTPKEALTVAASELPVLPHDFAEPNPPGEVVPENAKGVIEVIARAVDLVQIGEAGALCTAPINKKALKDGAGFAFPGHTEYLAHLGGDVPVVMMLACDALKVVPATIHIPLSEVPTALKANTLRETILITLAGLERDFGIAAPRVAVAGLNPHAGEGGAMGTEDDALIAPVIATLHSEGHIVTGPHPADTLFHTAARRRYDAAVAMYHDQALVPIKTLDFDGGVNVTLGLPFIRTSPDHGTAFDIAGQGIANPSSMIAALRLAWTMQQARRDALAPA